MKASGYVGFTMAFAATLVALGGETNAPTLDRAEREAVIAAANQAIYKHTGGTRIAKSLWGKAIEGMHPLRVVNDRVNVFIVTKEDETAEEGLYVAIPISSYAPGLDDRFLLFEKLSRSEDKAFGQLYRCKLKKPQPPERDK